jgi:hypothetical protein
VLAFRTVTYCTENEETLLKHQQALSTDPVMNPAAKNVLFVEKDGAKLDAEVDARTMPHGCMESKFHT